MLRMKQIILSMNWIQQFASGFDLVILCNTLSWDRNTNFVCQTVISMQIVAGCLAAIGFTNIITCSKVFQIYILEYYNYVF